jgi:hypothetical protein
MEFEQIKQRTIDLSVENARKNMASGAYVTPSDEAIAWMADQIVELKAQSKLIEMAGLQLLNIDEIEDAEDIATIHSNFNDAICLTPKNCLIEHDKTVKRQAFIDGVNFANHSDRSNHAVHVNQKASEYSESN